MLKLKNILFEQGNIKKFIIQTPAPSSILNIVRNTTPRGAAFILIVISNLDETPYMKSIIDLLKTNEEFGETSIWATAQFIEDMEQSYVYIIGPDQKEARRKSKFNVMIVPKQYIADEILGPDSADKEKRRIVYEKLITKYAIGDASVMFEEDINKLKTDLAPIIDKNRIAQLEAELQKLKQAVSTTTTPPAQTTTVVATDQTTTTSTDDIKTTNKAQEILDKLETEPIKLNTKSDDVLYIQDLMYRIGMKTPNLGDKNDIESWVAFRDAKPQYGTYGTRTKNFIDVIKDSMNISDPGSDITKEVLLAILAAGSKIGINETKKTYYLDKFIQEQFDITADIDKKVMGKTKTSTTIKDKINNTQYDDKDTYGSFHALGTPTEKLNRTTPIKYGSKGEEVKRMQDALNAIMGLMKDSGNTATWLNTKLKTDGDFGPTTKKIHDFITTAPMNLQDWKTTLQDYYENWEKTQKQASTVSSQDIKDSRQMEKIWQDVYNVFTAKPEKYFKQYSKWYNDQEEAAANWVIDAYNKAWGKELKRLSTSKSYYIQKNVKNINYVVEYIANKLIRAGYSGHVNTTFFYLDKKNKWQKQSLKFTWDYM